MNDDSKRWLIAAQAFQSFLMGVMVFGFFGLRMAAGNLFGYYSEGKRLPPFTHWILTWGPADAVSAWAFALFCAVTYLSLSLIAIVRADTIAQALARCYALAGVWLLSGVYLLFMLLSFVFPCIPTISRLQLPGDPPPESFASSHITPSSVDPRLWLAVSVLYFVAMLIATRRLARRKTG